MTIESGSSSQIGSSANIAWRVWTNLPRKWWQWGAPIRDAIIGGLSDSASWCYAMIGYAKAQTRLATAYGVWLDILCYDFLGMNLTRAGSQDDAFRAVIKATVLQERVTRQGMIDAVLALTGKTPWIFEPWNTYDTGGYANSASGQIAGGQFGYGVGQGGYGNMNLPGQIFMKVYRGGPSGVPKVAGYGTPAGGYGVGAIEYISSEVAQIGVTNDMILRVINLTKPTGTTVWVAFV